MTNNNVPFLICENKVGQRLCAWDINRVARPQGTLRKLQFFYPCRPKSDAYTQVSKYFLYASNYTYLKSTLILINLCDPIKISKHNHVYRYFNPLYDAPHSVKLHENETRMNHKRLTELGASTWI